MTIFDDDILAAIPDGEYEQLKQLVLDHCTKHEQPHIAIPTHRFADADAIATQVTFEAIFRIWLNNKNATITLVTPGGIPHSQNTAMLQVSETKTVEIMPPHPDFTLLVDASSMRASHVKLEAVAHAAIDPGHDSKGDEGTLLLGGDARATATIAALYYMKAVMERDSITDLKHIALPPMIATLIFFGIEQDTASCSIKETTTFDRLVRKWAFLHSDDDAVLRIQNYPISKTERHLRSRGLQDVFEKGSLAVASLDCILAKHGDIVSIVAQQLAREEWVQKAVAMGIVLEEGRAPHLKVSVRTGLDTIDTVSDIRKLIGPNAGGNQGIAAGTTPLGYRGKLLQLTHREDETTDLETSIIARLFLRQLELWRDAKEIPEPFQEIESSLKHNRRGQGKYYAEEDRERDTLKLLLNQRDQWSENRQNETHDEIKFPSDEEELAELFREASPNRTGTEREVMERLIHRQINRRARTVFGEES